MAPLGAGETTKAASGMTSNQTILITGVTGNQSGAVAQALQGTGFYLRGLTRKPDSERAAALARQVARLERLGYHVTFEPVLA